MKEVYLNAEYQIRKKARESDSSQDSAKPDG